MFLQFLKGLNKTNKHKIGGYIGLLNLTDWWFSTFTEEERTYINLKYQPMGSAENTLISGNVTCNVSTAKFLANLSSWFLSKKDLEIAKKIVVKAEQLYDDNIDIEGKHFYFYMLIKVYYKDRDNIESYKKDIEYCQKQIDISPQVRRYFLKQYPKSNLPAHTGFEQLAIIEEKNGNYKKALALSEKAKSEGWTNDWDKRIERLNKKL